MTEKEIIAIFEKTGAILKGHFRLSSGLHSGKYLQCAKVLQHPPRAAILCEELAKKFEKEKIDTVIAPALGGIIVSHEVARALNAKALFTERVEGKMALRRGFELYKKDKILVVEDVVTTGLSTKEVIEAIALSGAELIGVGCLVDRSKERIDFGARFESLVKIDIPAFEPQICPLCKAKIPVTKPGSRK